MPNVVCPANTIINNNSSFSNPSNIYTSDDAYGTKSVPANSYSYITVGFNTSGLPSNCVIDGFILSVEGKSTPYNTVSLASTSRVYNSGNIGSGPGSSSSAFTSSDETRTLGGSTNLWGTSGLTGGDAKNANFGIYCAAYNSNGFFTDGLSIDYMTLTIYYTLTAASGALFFGSEA